MLERSVDDLATVFDADRFSFHRTSFASARRVSPPAFRSSRKRRRKRERRADEFTFTLKVWAAAFALLAPSAAANDAGEQQRPPGVVPTVATTAEIFAAYRRGTGTYEPAFRTRREDYTLSAGGVVLEPHALVRDGDFRVDTRIEGATYSSGRAAGKRWRRTPAGSVRAILSDVQGDELDRYPASQFGIDESACSAAGETNGKDADWVLRCDSPGDLPRWYYVDRSSGLLVREVAREGARTLTTAFDDFRLTGGVLKPYRWRLSGTGGVADIVVTTVEPSEVSALDVALPESVQDTFVAPPSGTQKLAATFTRGYIRVPVRVGQATLPFLLDTGTTQIIMDVGAAARAGLHSTFGHAIAHSLAVGDIVARDLPLQTVDLFGGRNLGGILGNEFFRGHIVHIDYTHERVEVLPREAFVPPAGATEMAADFSEGLPLLEARAGSLLGERFALDTGSYDIVFTQRFAQRDPAALGVTKYEERFSSGYLEGPVAMRKAVLADIALGPVRFTHPEVDLEETRAGNLDIPLDGIFGIELLQQFEWWFDYSGSRLWIRVAGGPAA